MLGGWVILGGRLLGWLAGGLVDLLGSVAGWLAVILACWLTLVDEVGGKLAACNPHSRGHNFAQDR